MSAKFDSQIARDNDSKQVVAKMSVFELALAQISTYSGIALYAMPFVFYHMGLVLALVTLIGVSLVTLISIQLLLKTKDLTSSNPESLEELAYVLFGRSSIFVIIGDTLSTLMVQAFDHPVHDSETGKVSGIEFDNWWQHVLAHKFTSIILAGLLHVPIIFKHNLTKMKIVSYMLAVFLSICALMVVAEVFNGLASETLTQFMKMNDNEDERHILAGLSAIVLSFSIQQMMFQSYVELEQRSNERYLKASILATAINFIFFTLIGGGFAIILGEDIGPDFTKNLLDVQGAFSVLMRLGFCFVQMFHTPYIFFIAKKSLVLIYREAKENGLSTAIDTKLAQQVAKKTDASSETQLTDYPTVSAAPEDSELMLDGDQEGADAGEEGPLIQHQLQDSAAMRDQPSRQVSENVPENVYFWLVIILQVSVISTAIIVDSIESVTSILGTFFAASISFLFPGLAYLVALQTHGKGTIRKQWDTCFYQLMSGVSLLCFTAMIANFVYAHLRSSAGPGEQTMSLD